MKRKSLYRYAEKKWNDALVERGSVRIGTLQNFRKAEHKPGISDPFEGTKEVVHKIDNWNSGNERPGFPTYHARSVGLLGMINFVPLPNGELPQINIQNIEFARSFEDPDCFVYCTSHRLDKSVMNQFKGADSCVEIYDYMGFYECLTAALNRHVPVERGGIHQIRYASRTEICNGLDLGVPPTWIKDTEFSEQCEVRSVWHPLNPEEPIFPYEVEIPELSKFCRKIKVK